MPAVQEPRPRPRERGVLLEGDRDLLSVPLGDGGLGVELDRIARVVIEGIIALPGDSGLLVPEADRRARRVPVDAQRVRIDARLEAGRLGGREGGGQDLVPCPAFAELGEKDVLEAVPLGQGGAQARGRRGFARLQNVSVLLLIGHQAQV